MNEMNGFINCRMRMVEDFKIFDLQKEEMTEGSEGKYIGFSFKFSGAPTNWSFLGAYLTFLSETEIVNCNEYLDKNAIDLDLYPNGVTFRMPFTYQDYSRTAYFAKSVVYLYCEFENEQYYLKFFINDKYKFEGCQLTPYEYQLENEVLKLEQCRILASAAGDDAKKNKKLAIQGSIERLSGNRKLYEKPEKN